MRIFSEMLLKEWHYQCSDGNSFFILAKRLSQVRATQCAGPGAK